MNRLYSGATRAIGSLLLGVDLDSFNGGDAEEISDKVGEIVTALNLRVTDWADTYLRKAYRIGAGKARTALEILGKKPKYTPQNTESMLIEDTVALVVKRNATIRQSADDYLALVALAAGALKSAQIQELDVRPFAYSMLEDQINDAADRAVVDQISRGALAKNLRKTIAEGGSFVREGGMIKTYEGGAMWSLNTYSKMLA